jgi:hypothetical protein
MDRFLSGGPPEEPLKEPLHLIITASQDKEQREQQEKQQEHQLEERDTLPDFVLKMQQSEFRYNQSSYIVNSEHPI